MKIKITSGTLPGSLADLVAGRSRVSDVKRADLDTGNSGSMVRVRALLLVAAHLGADDDPEKRQNLGLRYLGTSGGDHVIRDREGRCYGADLVTRKVVQFIGIAPKVTRT